MKQLFYLLLAAVMTLPSCVSKQVALETESQRDSLAQVVRTKDSLIETVFADINAITDNLARIKARENIITAVDPEGIRRPLDQINSDIAAIDELMQQNRERIEGMERTVAQLRKANVRIKSLEHLVSDLNGQLEEKNNEISQLRTRVAEMSVEVEELEQKLEEEKIERKQEVDSLSQNNTVLDEQLHSVYYIVGQEKKLREAQIIDKRGFRTIWSLDCGWGNVRFGEETDCMKIDVIDGVLPLKSIGVPEDMTVNYVVIDGVAVSFTKNGGTLTLGKEITAKKSVWIVQ